VSKEDQGQTYLAFIQRELQAERERRRFLDARGIAVITTSGSLTTLLAAVGAFVSSRSSFRFPSDAVGPLILTLTAFAVAAANGIMVTAGRLYAVATPDQLNTMLTDKWNTDEVDARNYVARLDVKTIDSLRDGNNTKAGWLTAAIISQVVGLLALTVAVYTILAAAG
jgi:hypothetical protein